MSKLSRQMNVSPGVSIGRQSRAHTCALLPGQGRYGGHKEFVRERRQGCKELGAATMTPSHSYRPRRAQHTGSAAPDRDGAIDLRVAEGVRERQVALANILPVGRQVVAPALFFPAVDRERIARRT